MSGIKIKLTYSDVKEFINITTSFVSDIDVVKGRYVIDGRSLMGLFSIDFSQPFMVVIYSDDDNEVSRFQEAMSKFRA